MFGAHIGKGVVIKPNVNIKYPWRLKINDYSWIGEGVWIDNLANITIGKNCCLSQGVYLLTGNHHYGKVTFDLMINEIILEDGVWIGAKSIVTPGTKIHTHGVLAVNSVSPKSMDAYTIYKGNPAQAIKERVIHE